MNISNISITNLTQDLLSVYQSDGAADEDINEKYHLHIIVPILWSTIITFGFIGNGLIIYIILKRRLYRNSCTNCYIINVAIADLCFTLICVPITMSAYIYKEWIFGEFMCQFENLLMFSSVQAACLTLTAMTIDRYASILYPLKSLEFRTTKLALLINLYIWIASFTLNIPYFLYYKQVSFTGATSSIHSNELFDNTSSIYSQLNSTLLSNSSMNLSTFLKANNLTMNDSNQLHQNHQNHNQQHRQHHTTKIENPIAIHYCIAKFPSKQMEIILTIYTVMISYVLPLLTIIFCYLRMIIKIIKNSKDQLLMEDYKPYYMSINKKSSTCTYDSERLIKNQMSKIADENFNKNSTLSSSELNDVFLRRNNRDNSEEDSKSVQSLPRNSLRTNSLSKKLNNIPKNTINKRSSLPQKKNNEYVADGSVYSLSIYTSLKENNKSAETKVLSKKNSKILIAKMRTHSSSRSGKFAINAKKQKIKLLFLVATVAFTFATTWLPAHVIQIWKVIFNSTFPYNDTMYIIKVISHTLSYSNSFLNPFIYVFIGAKFRSYIYLEFNKIFQLICSSRKNNKNMSTRNSRNLSSSLNNEMYKSRKSTYL